MAKSRFPVGMKVTLKSGFWAGAQATVLAPPKNPKVRRMLAGMVRIELADMPDYETYQKPSNLKRAS